LAQTMDPEQLRAELQEAAQARATAESDREKAMARIKELLTIVTASPTPREVSFDEAASLLGISRANAYKLLNREVSV